MKRRPLPLAWLLVILLLLPACGPTKQPPQPSATQTPARVVCLYASYADLWLKAGGTLVGVTDDAAERGIDADGSVSVGNLTRPSLEAIAALQPDLVIASPDVPGQLALRENFAQLGIAAEYFTADTFEQYAAQTARFLELTGREDLRANLIDGPAARIAAVKGIARQEGPTVLLLRVSSSGAKAVGSGTVASEILADLGGQNIAAQTPSLLEDLSLEAIVEAQPDLILATALGLDDAQARTALEELFRAQPAWQALAAVQAGRITVLPKELFHYKPNERWGEAYETLAGVLYP